MKNREKYPNIDDALKAFEKHNKVCGCGCSFEKWLDEEASSGLNMAIAGVLLGSLFGEIIGLKGKPIDGKPIDKDDEKPSNDGKINDVECPICHGKHGVINEFVVPAFRCPDCGATIYIDPEHRAKVIKKDLMSLGLEDIKAFIADLGKKNNKKD